jgi:hypothetical protein
MAIKITHNIGVIYFPILSCMARPKERALSLPQVGQGMGWSYRLRLRTTSAACSINPALL